MIGGMLAALAALGVIQTAYAIRLRHVQGWFWALVNGLVALGVGVTILVLLPVVSPWLLGVLVGAGFLLIGAWMLTLGRTLPSFQQIFSLLLFEIFDLEAETVPTLPFSVARILLWRLDSR